MVNHDRVCIFIQLMYNKNDHLAKQSIFVRCLMSSLASTPPPPPPPLVQFENMVFVNTSTRENTRLIARASFDTYGIFTKKQMSVARKCHTTEGKPTHGTVRMGHRTSTAI